MSGGALTAGPHTVNTGLQLKDGAVYSVAFRATDGITSAQTVTSTNVAFDSTAVLPQITGPSTGGRTNAATISYLLSEPSTTGWLIITRTSGSADILSPYRYALSSAQLAAGGRTVATGIQLKNNAVYDFTLSGFTDRAGNTAPAVTASGVTFDTTAVNISNTTPMTKAIITTAQAGYRLSEQAVSGTVTFSWSGGNPDPASPRVYTMTVSDLTQGTHAVTPSLTLVDGAFYTVTFAATDMAGNAATIMSNALVYFDSTYDPTLPGNVDNTGVSADVVDSADVRMLEKSLGARPGDQHWNPVCDLDRNNIIDARDLMILRSYQTVL
jgi:hypothetical protein